MKLRPISRNDVAIVLAILAGIIVVSAPISAIKAIWQGDIRWLYTAGALLVLSAVMYFIATVLFDNTPEVKK